MPFILVIQIPAHITARNLQLAHQRNHNVREILAHPATRRERIVNRRIHVGRVRHVVEHFIQPRIYFLQQCQRFSTPLQFQLARQIFQQVRGSGDRKSTRLNSSHGSISYAVFCLKKKKKKNVAELPKTKKKNTKKKKKA